MYPLTSIVFSLFLCTYIELLFVYPQLLFLCIRLHVCMHNNSSNGHGVCLASVEEVCKCMYIVCLLYMCNIHIQSLDQVCKHMHICTHNHDHFCMHAHAHYRVCQICISCIIIVHNCHNIKTLNMSSMQNKIELVHKLPMVIT